jgi:hypothetical protein
MAGSDKGELHKKGGELFDIPQGPCPSRPTLEDQPGKSFIPRREDSLNNSTAALDNRKYHANPLMENTLRDTELERKQLHPPPAMPLSLTSQSQAHLVAPSEMSVAELRKLVVDSEAAYRMSSWEDSSEAREKRPLKEKGFNL